MRKIMIFSMLLLVLLLSVSAVSATDNATNNVVSVDETNDEVILFDNESIDFFKENSNDVVDNAESTDILKEDEINAKIDVINSENEYNSGAFKFKVSDIDNPNTSLEGKKISLYTWGDIKAGFSTFIDENNTASFKTCDLYEVYQSPSSSSPIKNLEVGNHTVEISTSGDVKATPLIVNLTITKVDINIKIDEFKEEYGTNKNVTILVTNKKDGVPVPKIILHLIMPQIESKDFYFQTNLFGQSTISVKDLDSGTYDIIVKSNDTNVNSAVISSKIIILPDYEDYDDYEDYEDYDDDYDKEKIKIIVKNIDFYYSTTYSYIVSLADENGDPVDDVDELKVVYSDGDEEIGEFDENGNYLFSMDKIANRKATFYLTDYYYKANPVTINVKISKSPVKISTKAYYSNIKQYTVLKATVKDSDSESIREGRVQFKINNQTYNVTVNNGVAVKKIKLTNAKTYTYTATYLENDHYKKSKISENKAYVYSSTKNARTFNIKGYKFTLTQYQYNNLINAKNTGKKVIFKVMTNKKIKQTIQKISYSYKWKYVKTVDLAYAHKITYYNSNYKYYTIKKHWVNDGVYYQTCKLYKKVEVKKVSYKTLNSRVHARIGYALNGQSGHDKYWLEIMTDNGGVVKGKLHWNVKSSTLPGLKTAKPIDRKNFVMR